MFKVMAYKLQLKAKSDSANRYTGPNHGAQGRVARRMGGEERRGERRQSAFKVMAYKLQLKAKSDSANRYTCPNHGAQGRVVKRKV